VRISAKHREHAEAAAKETGARGAGSNQDVASQSDVVILAVPYTTLDEVISGARRELRDKIIVDVTNPLKSDYSGIATFGTSAAEQLQSKVPGARVVKAFNTVLASRQADPHVDGTAADAFVAANDEDAKARVLELARSMGFRPIDCGPLSMARHLESLAFLNIALQMRHGWPWQAAWKLVGPTPERARKAA
jgi:NADPH-dependent F420 reductase